MGESEADKSCLLRIGPINRDLRDIVDFVDVFPFFKPQSHKVHKARTAP